MITRPGLGDPATAKHSLRVISSTPRKICTFESERLQRLIDEVQDRIERVKAFPVDPYLSPIALAVGQNAASRR